MKWHFHRLLPDRTYAFKGEDCHRGKISKERVTLLLGANMTGSDKLKPILISKSLKLHCFTGNNVETLPVTYKVWIY